MYIERQQGNAFEVMATDDDWATRFTYGDNAQGAREGIVRWTVPPGTAAGRYRIRHAGASVQGKYDRSTRVFELKAP